MKFTEVAVPWCVALLGLFVFHSQVQVPAARLYTLEVSIQLALGPRHRQTTKTKAQGQKVDKRSSGQTNTVKSRRVVGKIGMQPDSALLPH